MTNMKKLFFILLAVVIFLLPGSVWAAETITNFEVRAELQSNRLLRVTENITYDFGDEERHGIFRNIPTKYSRSGANYKLRLQVVEVAMDKEPVDYKVTEQSEGLSIKIGSPSRYVSGRHTYAITYETDRAINFFPDHSELYWNVTGNEWLIPIERAQFTLDVLTPSSVAPNIQLACFTGVYDSTETACTAQAQGAQAVFKTTRPLGAEEGLTIVVGLPAGLITAPTLLEEVGMLLADNWIMFMPLLVFLIMFVLWFLTGRDPRLGVVIPLYESPRGLNQLELAAAYTDGAAPERAFPAMIINLAQRGYLHVRYDTSEKNQLGFSFVKKKAADANLLDDERAVFEGLFKSAELVSVSDLRKSKFYVAADAARKAVWERLKEKKIFRQRPSLVRAGYMSVGVLVIVMSFMLADSSILMPVVGMLCGVIIIGFAMIMPRRTTDGANLLAEIKGFEWFLSVTEKDRLQFHNAPKKTPEQFQKMLPYAIALGVETEWAGQFEGIALKPPEWAEGGGWSAAHAVAFTSNLQSMQAATSKIYHNPASSAGSGRSGFSGGGSGGGFGGGGGGSW